MPERSLPDLAREIAAGAVRLTAATAAWLVLVAEFDEREGWAGYGIRSCAEWLAWQCGLSPGPAREHVRVARALRRLPVLSAAFAGGRLSYSKVRALTRVAEPATEAYLLEFALEATASQTERTVRQWRRADAPDEESTAARQRIDWWWDEAGMLVLTTRLPAETGAALVAAIDSLAERDARRERAAQKKSVRQQAEQRAGRGGGATHGATGPGSEGTARCEEDEAVALSRERTTARRCAALAALAEAAADRGRRPGDPPRREVVVHVDAAVLADDAAAGRAWIEGGPPLSTTQARRLLCEGTVVAMLERDREVLAVGRKRRLATRAQRRALLRRDGGCARPGCTESRIERLHAHHLRHWLHGGRTDLANLVLLCDACHGLVHALDLVMTRRNGRLVVTTPDGRRVWGTADTAFTHGLAGLDADTPAGAGDQTDGNGTSDGVAGGGPGGAAAAEFLGVHPIDTVRGRRPDLPAESPEAMRTCADSTAAVGRSDVDRDVESVPPLVARARRPLMRRDPDPARQRRAASPSRPVAPRPHSGRTSGTSPLRARTRRASRSGRWAAAPADTARRSDGTPRPSISVLLFPDGEPPLPDAMHVNGERMDLRYVVSVLMGYRDAIRRYEAESGASPRPGRSTAAASR